MAEEIRESAAAPAENAQLTPLQAAFCVFMPWGAMIVALVRLVLRRPDATAMLKLSATLALAWLVIRFLMWQTAA